jgi:hypothetical protein
MVVDSCLDRTTGRPVALEYLEELHVDVQTSVKVVVASHWHDDHIQGIARVLSAATSAEFWCSAALTRDEFLTLVGGEPSSLMISSGVSEFREVLEILERRGPQQARTGSISPHLAKSDVCVFRRHAGAYPAEVHALSPSDGAMKLSWHQIAQSIPRAGDIKRRAVALSPNQIAVALLVIVDGVELLLGADLEESKSPTLGWQAVVGSATRPGKGGHLFKIPHHGSNDAYSRDVWSRMLRPDPHAVVTPFAVGGKFLPSEADLRRLRTHTPNVYCTSRPGGTRPARRSGAVDGLADVIARDRRVVRGSPGHVRVRASRSGPPLTVHNCNGSFKVP